MILAFGLQWYTKLTATVPRDMGSGVWIVPLHAGQSPYLQGLDLVIDFSVTDFRFEIHDILSIVTVDDWH